MIHMFPVGGTEYMGTNRRPPTRTYRQTTRRSHQLGFLLGTRRYHSNVAEFSVGSLLTIRVEKNHAEYGP